MNPFQQHTLFILAILVVTFSSGDGEIDEEYDYYYYDEEDSVDVMGESKNSDFESIHTQVDDKKEEVISNAQFVRRGYAYPEKFESISNLEPLHGEELINVAFSYLFCQQRGYPISPERNDEDITRCNELILDYVGRRKNLTVYGPPLPVLLCSGCQAIVEELSTLSFTHCFQMGSVHLYISAEFPSHKFLTLLLLIINLPPILCFK